MKIGLCYDSNDDNTACVYGTVSDDIVTMLCLTAETVVSESSGYWPVFGEEGEELLFVWTNRDNYERYRDRMPFSEDTVEWTAWGGDNMPFSNKKYSVQQQ